MPTTDDDNVVIGLAPNNRGQIAGIVGQEARISADPRGHASSRDKASGTSPARGLNHAISRRSTPRADRDSRFDATSSSRMGAFEAGGGKSQNVHNRLSRS